MIPGENQFHESVDPLDELIRQTLRHSAPAVQPPSRVWERIQSQVTAGPAPTSHRPPTERLSRLLAPLVQGLAAAVIFILAGISLGSAYLDDPPQVESTSPLSAPVAVEQRIVPAQAAPVQRLGRFAAADDALDIDLSHPQKHPAKATRTTRPGIANADPDSDLLVNSRFAWDSTGP